MSQSDDTRIGTELAGFRIEALIGRGGMGVVYLAEQVRYGRKVALKVLAPELASDQSFRERFEQEWRMAAKLEHPNIVPIYEAGEAEGVLYIAMRYVDGIDLNALLAREGRLGTERAVAIVAQAAAALDEAHKHGVVHRDVKPGNILVTEGRGLEAEHVYLTDFGIAKQSMTRSGMTRTGLFVGTVDYSSPEQIEGRPLDARADVYALGCVLYQCLAGSLPFERDSEAAMLYAHLKDPPPTVTAIRPELPTEFDQVITKALAKSPDERYTTCRELAAAARTALSAKPTVGATRTVVAGSPTVIDRETEATTVGRPRRPWWRTRAALAGLAVLLIAGIGAGVGIAVSGGGGGGGSTTAGQGDGPTVADGDNNGTTGSEDEEVAVDDSGGGAIAFASLRGGNSDIYAMGLDGSGRVRLTDDEAVDGGPRWSPDGTRIAFWSDRGGDQEIYVMDADGSNVVQLTDNDVDDGDPDWSPDGSQLVYSSRQGDTWDLYVMNDDGSGQVQLFTNGADNINPSWSPDGSTIAFATLADGDYEIATVSAADGSGFQALTQNQASDDAPDWSPDGSQIVFSSSRGEGNFDIWVMNGDGSSPRRLATALEEDAFPRWVDEERIVFDGARDGDFEIYLMNADGSGQTQLTDDLTSDFTPDPSLDATVPAAGIAAPFLDDDQAYPTEREAGLLASVPSGTRAACQREADEDKAPRALAGVVCTNGAVTVYYDVFRTKQAMDAYYKRFVQLSGATASGESCDSSGAVDTTWNVEGETRGKLLCFIRDGRAVVVWTHNDLLILAYATRQDAKRSQLYTWWAGTDAGPLEP